MKKLFLLTALLTLAFAAVACDSLEERIRDEFDSNELFQSSEEVLGFSVISSVTALSAMNYEATTADAQPAITRLSQTADVFEILEDIEALEPYLALVMTFMGEGNSFSVSVDASEEEDYDHVMLIQSMNLKGETVVYTFHYNETIEYDDDDDDTEFESVIEGIMIIDGVTYTLYGEREVDEGEESLELIASLDDENYVTFYVEIEDDGDEFESEFEYEMFVNNQLVKRTEITFEREEDEIEMELKFIDGNRESEYEFEIEFDEDEITIEIEYKIVVDGNTIEEGDIEITIMFDEATNQYTIVYKIDVQGEGEVIVERDLNDEDADDTDEPDPTEEPDDTDEPDPTEEPDDTDEPDPTEEPDDTDDDTTTQA